MDTGVNERGENERQSENDSETKAVSYVRELGQRTDKSWCRQTNEERIDQRRRF